MKIAMIGQFPPHIGGVGVHIHTLSKKLVEEGHEVYVITYPHKDIENIDGINVIGTKGLNVPGLRGILFKINGKKSLEKLVKEKDIDIIHGHYLFPAGLAAVEVGNNENIPTYVTAHGSDMFEMYKKQSFMRPIIKKVLKKADVILAVSSALKDEIINTNVKGIKDKTRIYWNSVDIDKFKPNNDYKFKKEMNLNDKPIVLFIGNIIKRKNVNSLIEAKKLSKTDYNLVIVGDGPLLKSLKEKVAKENIKDVVFTGKRNDIEDIIPSCDLLVLPSYSESFGLVLIEALACSKPVIGSNVGGIKEIITDDVGLLVDPNNNKEISSKIDLILNDEKLKENFKENARLRAKKFSKVEIPYDELK
ncbi:glycosyltransferase family 4 protein [Methanobrevibacter sp. OttesenSCG-928-K11]|nr:glycosyltransferase family 4 protein [Methanobrevibacter sp. OttesenSCG-928-K11]MDL2270470.1 glycosyltransferase family 4 protein [Methanobrevibacter sp. OttesenSCG-928-I08]